MPGSPTKLTRRHKLFLASLATVSLSLGAAGIVSAAQNPPGPSSGSTLAEEVDGVDCQDGIDAATGAECDGGPSANAADDPAEGDTGQESEADEAETADAAEEVDGVDCENGIDAATGAECDGGPSANPQDGADDTAEAANEPAAE
jgi:hypothetical protein